MSDFSKLSVAVTKRFEDLSKNELFVTVNGDELWDAYLAAFPKGTNNIFRERTEHDCSCCRNFIKNIGNVVSIQNGKVVSIWEVEGLEYPYDEVAAALSKLVRTSPITELYRMSESKYGAVFTVEALEGGGTRRWNHFSGDLEDKHFSKLVGGARGDYKTTVSVLKRALVEFTQEAFTTVIDLIDNKSIYRGEEHQRSVKAFYEKFVAYHKLKAGQEAFVWSNAGDPIARFRNTAIGTLIQDLSAGVYVTVAVSAFEKIMAPANYKRTTALITPSMVKEAMKTIAELDLEEALKRRFAKISDVSVNNVLWVDRSVSGRMKGGIADVLMASAVANVPKPSKEQAENISIDDFMTKVVPKATEMEVLVNNTMQANFISLTAPVDKGSPKLFVWDNDFAWSYEGNVADSIKERVKRAGGNVTNAKMRVSLSWHNGDDLDIHVIEPDGNRICFHNKGTKLDVDMNAGGPKNDKDPVENVSWTSVRDGLYSVIINQYNQRSSTDVGFELEVENEGVIQQFQHAKVARGEIPCLGIAVKDGVIREINLGPDIAGGLASKEIWGVKTETFTKVSTLMKSPNHWDGNEVGNRHWFFMLEGCKNNMPTRGIYNEFLKPNLMKHRKVFEILGDKTKCQPTDDQLSGVGFSSTKGESVLVRIAGQNNRRVFNVNF